MVKVSILAAFAGMIVGSLANCDKLSVKLQPYDEVGCTSHKLRHMKEMKQGKCYTMDDFASYQAYPVNANDKHSGLEGRNCTVVVYDDKKCHGDEITLGDLRERAGLCGNARFNKPPGHSRQGRSARFYCVPDDWATTTAACPASTVVVTKIQPPFTRTPRPYVTATIKETTTIWVPPVATVHGTTTVWVPPSSSTMSVQTFTVTFADKKARRNAADKVEAKVDHINSKKADKKKNRGPDANCYGWNDDEMTLTDCDEVSQPPASATPKLAFWSTSTA